MGLTDHNLYFTYEQFLELAESIRANTGYRTEYTNGEIIYFSPSAKHSMSINNIISILREKLPSNCMVISELHVKFADGEYRIPDVAVFCGKDIKDKYNNDTLHLEMPKLIFEVLSDSTEKHDREYKMKLYADAGIEEYLLVDYKNRTIEQYYLDGSSYKLNSIYKNEDNCKLLLYSQVTFKAENVFEPFING